MVNNLPADCGESCVALAFTWRGPCARRSARSRLPGFLLLLLATSLPATHLRSRAYFTPVAHQIFAGVRILTSAAQYLQHFSNANMSDPPPAKKPAFSLYGDLIAPNGDSSVISSGPVKYDMKPKDPEPDAQKKKNGRVAFYISSS
jgi:hypothetical protein